MDILRDQAATDGRDYRTKVLRMDESALRQEISDLFERLLASVKERSPSSCAWELNICVTEYMARFRHRSRRGHTPVPYRRVC
jgi:hypothetical protein